MKMNEQRLSALCTSNLAAMLSQTMKRLRFGLDFEKAGSIRKAVASMLHHCFPTATERLFPFDRMALERTSLMSVNYVI